MIEERYIIDTDPGDDIDDAFAITLAVWIRSAFIQCAYRFVYGRFTKRICIQMKNLL